MKTIFESTVNINPLTFNQSRAKISSTSLNKMTTTALSSLTIFVKLRSRSRSVEGQVSVRKVR